MVQYLRRKALKRAGMSLDDMQTIELNEHSQRKSISTKALNLTDKQDIVNINGGAIALGHPLGCSGARITVTLLNAMAVGY